MAAIVLPRGYRTQPRQAPQIDWSHPLARGLRVAWVASHPLRVLSDPSIGPVALVTNTAAQTANARGLAAQCNGSLAYVQIGPNNVFQANTWTGLVVAQSNSSGAAGSQALFEVATGPASGTTDRALYLTSNNVAATLYDGGTKTATGTSGAVDGKRAHVMAAMSDGSSIQAWLNGRQEATSATGNGGFAGYGSSAYLIMGYGAGGGGIVVGSDARTGLFLWWDRALSDSEHRVIADSPYSVFAHPKRSWLSAVAAPPPSPSGRPFGFIAT